MTSPTQESITKALSNVIDPADGKNIVEKGMVQGIDIHDETVNVMVAVDPVRGPALEDLRLAAERNEYIADFFSLLTFEILFGQFNAKSLACPFHQRLSIES